MDYEASSALTKAYLYHNPICENCGCNYMSFAVVGRIGPREKLTAVCEPCFKRQGSRAAEPIDRPYKDSSGRKRTGRLQPSTKVVKNHLRNMRPSYAD